MTKNFKKEYMSAKDLMELIPNLKIQKARIYINELQNEMLNDGYFIPECRPKVVLTKYVINKFFKKGESNGKKKNV